MFRRYLGAVVLVVAGAVLPVAAAGTAEAIPVCLSGYQCTRTYYNNSAHTQVIGQVTRFCDGTTDTWGTTSAYQVTDQVRCND